MVWWWLLLISKILSLWMLRHTMLLGFNSELMFVVINGVPKTSLNMIINLIDGPDLIYRCVDHLTAAFLLPQLPLSVLLRGPLRILSVPHRIYGYLLLLHGIALVIGHPVKTIPHRWLRLMSLLMSSLCSGAHLIGHLSRGVIDQGRRGVLETVLQCTIFQFLCRPLAGAYLTIADEFLFLLLQIAIGRRIQHH
jgi:hypothetical protein